MRLTHLRDQQAEVMTPGLYPLPSPVAKKLGLSMLGELQIAKSTLRAGAMRTTLLRAIFRIASSGRFIDPQIAEHIALEA